MRRWFGTALAATLAAALVATAVAAPLNEAERAALAAALSGVLAPDAPAAEIRSRLAENERTLALAEKRAAALEAELAGRAPRIADLKRRLAADPGAMRAPRDQVQLMRLSHQDQLTLSALKALAPTIERLTGAVARDRVRLLALQGGAAALAQRLEALGGAP